jgi:SAM-dependent methyltransferase
MSAQERPKRPNQSPRPSSRQPQQKIPCESDISNVYQDEQRARAYSTLQFPGTYYLAFRDLPVLIRRHSHGSRALDFGCGTGRSTRFLKNLGLNVVGADISQAMLDQARALDPSGESTTLFVATSRASSRRAVLISFWRPSRLTTCQPKRKRTR